MHYSNLSDILNFARIRGSKPFDDAANLGTQLGHRFSRMLNSIGHKYNFETPVARAQSRVKPPSYNENSIQAYLRGISLTQPVKVTTDNGYAYDVFDSSDYDRRVSKHSVSSGQLSDPFSGETIDFNGPEEFKAALAKLEELRQNYLREQAQANLLLASGGGPAQVAEILKNTAPHRGGRSILEIEGSEEAEAYQAMMKSKVYDAIMASISSMTLAELKAFASWVPGLTSIIAALENRAKKSGISSTQMELTTAGQIGIEEIKQAKLETSRKAIAEERKKNQIDLSHQLDFSVIDLSKIFGQFNKRKTRDKLDWNPTIDIA